MGWHLGSKIFKALHPGLPNWGNPFESGTAANKVTPYLGAAAAAYFGAPYLSGLFGGGGGAAAAGSLSAEELAGLGATSASQAGGAAGAAAAGAGATTVSGEYLPWLQRYGGLIGSGIGGLSTYAGQQSANEANMQLAQQQMAFQQQMSSTAYQRATADMMKAGLNPMLGYSQGGASSGAGAMPTMQNALGPAISTALQGFTMLNGIDKLRAETQNVDADTLNKAEMNRLLLEQVKNTAGSTQQIQQATRNLEAQVGSLSARSAVDQASQRADISARASASSLAASEAAKASITKGLFGLLPGAADLRSTAKDFADLIRWRPSQGIKFGTGGADSTGGYFGSP